MRKDARSRSLPQSGNHTRRCHGFFKSVLEKKRGTYMKNMGKIDRIIRLIAGAGLTSLLFLLNNNWRYIGILGIVLLVTAAVGVCPLYMPFKIDTRKKN